MAADWRKSATAKIAALPDEDRQRFMERHGLESPSPAINLPHDLLESKNGIGVYFNPNDWVGDHAGVQRHPVGAEKEGQRTEGGRGSMGYGDG